MTLGEILTARTASKDDIAHFGIDDEDIEFKNKVEKQIGRLRNMISVIVDEDGDDKSYILSLERFLPYYSEPSFNTGPVQIELYRSMAFWLFDTKYACAFLHNSCAISIAKWNVFYNIPETEKVFRATDAEIDTAVDVRKYIAFNPKNEVTLRQIFEAGDLSFAPDPFQHHYKGKNGLDLGLAVINQMMVSFILSQLSKYFLLKY